MRPARFDRRVTLDRPDMRGREAILRVHIKGKPVEPEVNLGTIARGTPGFVGADLENLVNEGAILSARRNKKSIGQSELEEAIERVVMGPERKSRLISVEEKRIIAYHEAGHAVVMNAIPEADPVQKNYHCWSWTGRWPDLVPPRRRPHVDFAQKIDCPVGWFTRWPRRRANCI